MSISSEAYERYNWPFADSGTGNAFGVLWRQTGWRRAIKSTNPLPLFPITRAPDLTSGKAYEQNNRPFADSGTGDPVTTIWLLRRRMNGASDEKNG
ncbi:hypothetical protein DWY22_03120 [Heyndrickxia coagulans]|nr:hypothetical protein DWY22_03120 [Heyndrickxia coagulans]RGR99894.1 hypothetical protein DWY16_03760 [Heyndrickxia coagulans]